MGDKKIEGKCPGCGCECGQPLAAATDPVAVRGKSCEFTPCGYRPEASGQPEAPRCPQCGAVLKSR
jgi:hypothetical protein